MCSSYLYNLPNLKKFSADKRPTSSVYAQSFQGNQTKNNLTKKAQLSTATVQKNVGADSEQELPTSLWGQMATALSIFLMARTMWTIFTTLYILKYHFKKQLNSSRTPS